MARFKARIRQPRGPRDTFVEAESEWEAIELIKGQYGLERRDIFLIRKDRETSWASREINEDDDLDESSFESVFYAGVSLLFWGVIGLVTYRYFF
ncbi:hypothetical protein [Microvirga splendida]|uniref:Uncharacterized protein n=1 Tax=Microvirga splendida TaxID=2795727 RepID=A0ABS0Y515_9HYPH|nr:hypothetical protein [Microvirga splendida]MBJ6127393.1 hypothetical protein [Microvirga splendida]